MFYKSHIHLRLNICNDVRVNRKHRIEQQQSSAFISSYGVYIRSINM